MLSFEVSKRDLGRFGGSRPRTRPVRLPSIRRQRRAGVDGARIGCFLRFRRIGFGWESFGTRPKCSEEIFRRRTFQLDPRHSMRQHWKTKDPKNNVF
jgi:hypothetical protein